MKKYKQLKETSIRPYKPSDFKKVFKIFVEFQKDAKVGTYHNITKGHGEVFIVAFLAEELKKLIRRSKHNWVAIDTETGEIWGFGCLTEGTMKPNSLDLQVVFKDPNYIFNRIMKTTLVLFLKKVANGKRVFAALGQREKFQKYLDFVKKIFKVKVHGQDGFGKVIIEFLWYGRTF